MPTLFKDYANRLSAVLNSYPWENIAPLAQEVERRWKEGRQVFLCGNGGSAGNAIHLANDYLYGIAKETGKGLKVQALTSNPAVMTCLANDVGYDVIFSEQLAVLGQAGDLIICLSGSGNSPNIVKVLDQAKSMGIKTCAILGFSGGKAKALADISIHFPIDDMQIAEDMQLIVGHMLMQYLYSQSTHSNI
ncbi:MULTISPECIES: SIS domain-containing protein [unclassified Polynucleobacter]|uniref:SIS domain-containing protein n=1 Tax=unclassified Polynucleobacter TaxID=2640945 RepID=UPI0008CCB350|nr:MULTISPECIES: SIS domain-containing protein [unclassified Polynucleobacter]OHC09839.1 MAG: phosphoheptose isomerase [Polynucleobacter sp. GWA2_45_21]HBK42801.1 phosphoheptose isomerase [Polynucleobacter sp.]